MSRFIGDILSDLDDNGKQGLDLSPGDELCREAAAVIRRLIAGTVKKEEIHDICHNLHNCVGVEEFAEGCAKEQRKLYGTAPHADKLREFKAYTDGVFQRLAAEAQTLRESILDAANEVADENDIL